jgi:dTDP-4-amino-4,6-dideoxygalactose transaminase
MWGYLAPAASEVFLPRVLTGILRGDRASLDDELCKFLGSAAALAGTSWVVLLGELLRALAQPARPEVILPSYACNEFSKAVLLAGLVPRYVDLRDDLAADVDAIGAAVGPRTLAVLAINNVGRASDNAAIRALCDRAGVLCIEDATYTFLGRADRDGRRFGSYGHYAVLNFSEGKIVPVGGGAVIANTVAGGPVLARVRAQVGQRPPRSTAREVARLFVYRAGASRWGYSAYRVLRAATGADWKQRLSMEPTRRREVGRDLERDASGATVLPAGRDATLAADAALRPLGRATQLCGIAIIRDEARVRAARRRRYDALARAIAGIAAIEVLPFPAEGTCIKAPILIAAPISAAHARRLDRLGVIRGYATDYPTYGLAAYPRSNRMFEQLFTLPLHRDIDDRAIRAIAGALAEACR